MGFMVCMERTSGMSQASGGWCITTPILSSQQVGAGSCLHGPASTVHPSLAEPRGDRLRLDRNRHGARSQAYVIPPSVIRICRRDHLRSVSFEPPPLR